jgi:uroporphyrin-III C-methyltransferase
VRFSAAAVYRVDPAITPWAALVGAGPGDAGLLTRRGVELLAAADVVLHDWLVGPDVLALARPGCRLVDVGKAKGRGCRQDEIERLLVTSYRAGFRVVRLKGGDPFVFGRGVEEVRAAHAAGFDVELVPGVSSSLAAPELAGVAVTERGVSGQVTIVSGHRVDGDNDWASLAAAPGTLVVLMAATTGPSVAARLLSAGMDPATPIAVIAAASCADQAIGHGDLASLAGHPVALPSPCVIVIGEVAAATSASAEGLTTDESADQNERPSGFLQTIAV